MIAFAPGSAEFKLSKFLSIPTVATGKSPRQYPEP